MANSVQEANWSKNYNGYLYGTRFVEPGIDGPTAKNIVELTHVDGYKYGRNFLGVRVIFSDINDPASGGDNSATEVCDVSPSTLTQQSFRSGF
ncbi:hypothetical protein D3C84_979430 [compost metagenome]